MYIPANIKQQVEQRIKDCINTAARHYNRGFITPEADYSLKGRTAGIAKLSHNRINLNSHFLLNETDTFIHRTVAHEVAHLICHALYPHVHQRKVGSKASPHGYEWQSIMRVLGVDPNRCHNYDISGLTTRTTKHYTYQCTRCNKQYALGPKRHRKLQANPKAYRCKCSYANGTLKHVDTNKPQPTQQQTTDHQDKQTAALAIYQCTKIHPMAEVIREIAKRTGMTSANARYYYMKFQKRGM